MPNLNQLILTGADYKVFLSFSGGGTYPLKTAENFSYNNNVENELIYAIGTQEPVGNKTNARAYTGKFSLQAGELNAILLIEGYTSASYISNCVIGVTAIQGGFARTFNGVNLHSEAEDIKRKDKETLINIDFTALSIL